MLTAADLQDLNLFAGLPESETAEIAASVLEIRHEPGKVVMQQGSHGFALMVIIDGQASVTTMDGHVRALRVGDHFGEMGLLDHQARSATVVADTELRLAVITQYHFKDFLHDHPEVTYRLMQTLTGRLREAEARAAARIE